MVGYALSATSQILISARARKNGAEGGGGGRHAFLRVSHGATVAPDTKRDARTHRSHAAPQSDSAHHSRTRHAWRKDGRTKEGRTRRKDGAGIILRELSHGMLTLLALDRAHALSHHNSLLLCRSLPFLYRGISFMHFGLSRVLNDGAFANYRPTEPLHRQSGTTTKQARVLIRLLLSMFSFVRIWISFIPP